MKINVLNSNFTSLSCAVAYRTYRFIPSVSDRDKVIENFDFIKRGYEASNIKYHGTNDTILDGKTLLEYNFSQLVEKSKFNNTYLPSLLDPRSKDLVGKELGSIERINEVLFPTISYDDVDSFGYYGSMSLTTLDQTLYFISLLSGEWKLELYENTISENLPGTGKFYDSEFLTLAGVEHVDPAIIIYLGATSGTTIRFPGSVESYKYMPRSLYFHEENGDPFTDSYYGSVSGEIIDLVDYRNLFDEVHGNKLVYILFSPKELEEELRIFASVSQYDKNINRNMNKYYLRNDEFWSTRDFGVPIKEVGNFIFDRRSDTLLGQSDSNKVVSPILKRKLRNIELEGDTWCKYREYGLGEKVSYKGNTWISLVSGNLGNSPKASNCWSPVDLSRDSMTRISIISDSSYSNSVSPNGVVRVKDGFDQKFILSIGKYYELDKAFPIGDGKSFYEVSSLNPLSGPLFNYNESNNSINITGYSWKDSTGEICGPGVTGKLVFYFNRRSVMFRFTATTEEGQVLNYQDWDKINLSIEQITAIPDNSIEELKYLPTSSISTSGDLLFPMAYGMGLKFLIRNNLYSVSGVQIVNESRTIPNAGNNELSIPGQEDSTVLNILINRKVYTITLNTAECLDRFIFENVKYEVYGGDDLVIRFYSPTDEWTLLSDFYEDYRIISTSESGEIDGNLSLDMKTKIFTYTIPNVGMDYNITFEKL